MKSSIKKLSPIVKNYIWGGDWLQKNFYRGIGMDCVAESWELSIHSDGVSYCGDEPLTKFIERNPCLVDKNGNNLPILIKYIDAKRNLSVQVHPNDEYAEKNGIGNGKTEMWYVIHAEEGAGIYNGFKQNVSKDEFLHHVKNGTIESVLNFISVKEGDCYLIKAGTVHAICSGCVICEVQQNSNTTFRIYDYNRKDSNGNLRQLHLHEALEVINFSKFEDETNSHQYVDYKGNKYRVLTECDYFRCRELLLDGEFIEIAENSFIAINIINGKGLINGEEFTDGDSFFVPYNEKITIKGKAKILLIDTNGE